MALESVVRLDSVSIKYGPGATREVGYDMGELGAKRVMVVTDPNLVDKGPVKVTLKALEDAGLEPVLYGSTRIEPTDASLKEAIDYAVRGEFDGFVAVGGGSSMDTAKVANLYSTYPADFPTYVNAPIGKGTPVPGPLKPLVCIPTTAGTGSETTGVAVFDLVEMHAKTGIAHRYLRPTIGIVDPNNTRTLPGMIAACTGFDVLAHALESFTAIPYNQRQAPENPLLRSAYQGSNPVSDVWAVRAIEMASSNIVRVVSNPTDEDARSQMIMAATFAGISFGAAGTHLGHGMSYPVSGMVRGFIPEGYPPNHPIIPHGMAVILLAPSVFRFTAPTNPERHLEAARLMGADTVNSRMEDAGNILADAIISLMKETGMPNGLAAVGFTAADVDKLVEGTLPQQRVTRLSPRPFTPEDLRQMFLDSQTCW
ncbi:MAG: iron-containing alcohol dehydrogenase [Dehalococcoidales bacterium]|nr:MAG: iron-containing alcohol dehydrogenase [Dehalococcoidales bacterium]